MRINELMSIAEDNKDGFTVDLKGNSVNAGFIVAMKETQNSFGTNGAADVLNYAERNETLIGGWLDTESGNFYFDAVLAVEDKDEALELGRENEQLAIFDLNTFEEIRL